MDDISLYINFVLCAVFGRMGNADAIMRAAGGSIRSVADYIAKKTPITSKPLYRGMLLDPTIPFLADSNLTFLSWSEDYEVAKWFACTGSVISEYVMQHRPNSRGYVITLRAPRSRVLFHYSWASIFNGLSELALRHPLLGVEGQRQIAWSLQTQSEIITEPVDGLKPEPVDKLDAAALDLRFAPPWLGSATDAGTRKAR